MSIAYAGIGSRSTPDDIKINMIAIARILGGLSMNGENLWLRTGGCVGADQAFATGLPEKTILYLPWLNYEFQWRQDLSNRMHIGCPTPSQEAIELASEFHPNWSACSSGARLLHGRNTQIILGKHLKSPVKFVLYWAKMDMNTGVLGGTGMGIRIAQKYNIPHWNMKIDHDFNKIIDWALEKVNA